MLCVVTGQREDQGPGSHLGTRARGRDRGWKAPFFGLYLTGMSRGGPGTDGARGLSLTPRATQCFQHRYGCSCLAGWKLRCTLRVPGTALLCNQQHTPFLALLRRCSSMGEQVGLFRNGKRASSIPGPRPNFLQTR